MGLDEYLMPMADLSINAVTKHKVLSFIDGNAGYNQIKMAKEDIHKTAFRCPGHVGAYEYLVVSFKLKNAGGKEQAIYYLSKILTEVETRHYMLPCHIHIIAKTDVIKYMLSKPILTWRIGKWILTLSEFSFQYVPKKAIKGQAVADFLVEHQESQDEIINIPRTLEVASVWISSSKAFSGQRIMDPTRDKKNSWIVIIDPNGTHHYYSFILYYQETTNNRAEYEALIIGLEILIKLGATEVEVFGDSELVINQLNGEYKCRHITMVGYYLAATQLLVYWGTEISVSHIPRESNSIANEMAQMASGAQIQERKFEVNIEVQKWNLPSIFDRGFNIDVMTKEPEIED
ncbi:uncharacterized protein LOC125473964 [Pyrus x bretschneideri]|uniref:uncharacterized protein LOC125473964 n=1 Tax=Pyrus x bretschneideri TaxID=225117 RepID=UPI00202E6D4F|nr:uncharacterized protein LOC125473964 [Pyrus x bretschneideri]